MTDKRRTSKGDKGIVSFKREICNQRGEAVHSMNASNMYLCREVATYVPSSAVIGGAASPNGKLQTAADAPLQALEHEILAPLVIDAMAAAGLPKEEVGALVFAMCRPYTLQKYFATFMANYLRLPLKGTIMEVMGNGMTGGLAFDQAATTVCVGRADVALALGINMESAVYSAEHAMSSMRTTATSTSRLGGFTPISWYAMDAVRYLHEHRRHARSKRAGRRQEPAPRRPQPLAQ